MRELLQVQDLTKTFQLSAKQQKLEKTKEKVRVAVNQLYRLRGGDLRPAGSQRRGKDHHPAAAGDPDPA